MELPHMGQHCSEQSCKQLDFLPMKCDACVLVFCKDHLLYDLHNCASKYKKDVQVPVCPLCNSPVPVARGSLPDSAVSSHIERGCARVTKEKVFNNACSKHKCKKKEMVPLTCDACKQNFCLGHRHPQDHDCKGKVGAREAAAAAAANRQAAAAATGHSRPTPAQKRITSFFSGAPVQGGRPTVGASSSGASGGSGAGRTLRAGTETARSLQPGGLSEDEALAAALAASLAGPEQQGDVRGGGQLSQEEEDRLLAQALAESERTARREGRSVAAGGSSQADKSCSMQ